MEIKGKVHCFFEQSGTFKNEFIKLGIPAEDYDIQNNFGQTDHVIDLFAEIENAYSNRGGVFDNITPDDLILAFFPCIYFCENNALYFCGAHMNLKNKSTKEKTDIILERSKNREHFYNICLKLCSLCDMRGLRLIVENPYTTPHYLVNNFPYAASVIDNDRTKRGDCYKKPTQYIFINCVHTYGESYQRPIAIKRISEGRRGIMAGMCSEERSMISPDYARNFICDFILGKEQQHTELTLF